MELKQRNAFLACLLSVFCVGLGQLYKGQAKKALCLIAVILIMPAVFFILAMHVWLVLTAAVLIIFVYLYNLFDAAKRVPEPVKMKWFNKWYFYLGFAIVYSYSYSALTDYLRHEHYEAFKIPAAGMLQTLEIGDHILVSKGHFKNNEPLRGDIVVFTLPDDPATSELDEGEINILKRIVGLPGETVEVRGMEVYINGELLEEEYAIWQVGGRGNFGPLAVPAGRVFLLGDNRDYSNDSRYWPEPFLPIERLKGRAIYIYWNLRDFSRVGTYLHSDYCGTPGH